MTSRIVRLAAFGSAALMLAACSASGGASVPGSSSPSASGGAGITPSAPSSPVTLTILDWGSADYVEGAKATDAAFMEAYPTITIKREPVPYDDTPTRLRALIAAGSGPDILPGFPGAWVASFRNGYEDLNAYVTPEQREQWPLLSSSVSPDGGLYLLADTAYAYTMGYNKDLFSQAGVSGPPATWAELKDACQKLSTAGITPIAAGWKDGYYAEGFMYSFIGALLDPQQKAAFMTYELPYTDPLIQRSIESLVELNTAGCFGTGAEGRVYYDDLRNQFASGEAAMVLEPAGQGPMEEGNLYPTSLGDAFDVFPLPSPEGAANAQFMDYGPNGGWGIASWSPNKEAAWLYLTFLMGEQNQQANWDNYKAFPAVKDVTISSTFEPSNKILEWTTAWPNNGTVYTAFPQTVLALYEKQIVNVMTGRMTVSELTAEMQKALDLEKARLTS